MKFECDSCHAQYMIADEKVGKKGVKVKCKKCQHVIIVRPGHAEKIAAPAPPENVVAAPVEDDAPPPALTYVTPPPGYGSTGSDSAHAPDDGFAQGGPTDPVARAMPQESDGASLPDPDTTGPGNKAPAPISMFGDQTQLSVSQAGMMSQEDAPRPDQTELGASPEQSEQPQAPEPAPPAPRQEARNDATVVTRPPEMSAAEPPPPAPPKEPEQPAATGSELDDQIAGMFTAMFDESQASADGADDHRGPTRVLDKSAVDALRKQAQERSETGSPLSLESGPDPRQLEAGLVMKGADAAPSGADDGPADAVWHAAIDDQDVGPLALAEIGRHIESGRVDRFTLVWKIGMDDWLPAGDVAEVSGLFDKVPPPRISRGEDAVRGAMKDERRPSSFDIGSPIDDGPSASSAPSPFDEASDPAWRPHGLTDVYQAANLAEAAVGMGMGGGMAMSGPVSAPIKMSAQTASEPEWRPGAASALSALVQDEIKRLDQPPPAADDVGMPADDASINAPIFGSLGARPDLENGADLSDPSLRPARPQAPSFAGSMASSMDAPAYPAPSFAQPSFASSQPPKETGQKNPMVLAGIAVGGLVVVLLLVLVGVMLAKGDSKPADVVMIVNGEAKMVRVVNGTPMLVLPTGELAPMPKEPAKPAEDKPVVVAKTDTPAPPADATNPGTPATDATPPPADAAPVAAPGADGTKEPKEPKVASAATPKTGDRKPPPRREDKPADKPPEKVASGGKKCDPVLDFDCKAGSSPAAKPSGDVKDTLSKTDVLAVIKAGAPAISACGAKNKVSGLLKMTWRVQTSGKTTDVQVADSKYAGTPVGSCATGVIKGWRFPAHQKAISPVTFPFKL